MKIVIIGVRGLIGSKLAPLLRSRGHAGAAGVAEQGVNAVTGKACNQRLQTP